MARWLQFLFFSHVSPIIKIGLERPLQAHDLPGLPTVIQPEILPDRFRRPCIQTLRQFLTDIFLAQWGRFCGMFALNSIILVLQISGPLLLGKFITALQVGATHSSDLLLAFGMIFCGVGQAVVAQHYFYAALMTRIQCINGLNVLIFGKSLRLSRQARLRHPTGEIVNFIGADSESLSEFLWIFTDLTFTMLMLMGVTVALYLKAGIAAFGALFILLVLLPISRAVGRRFNAIDTEIMARRDDRVSYVSQVLSGIRVVKFFGWERKVYEEIDRSRLLEVAGRRRLAWAGAQSATLYSLASFLIGISIFGGLIYLNGHTDPATIFSCLALFALIENPFGNLTHQIAGLAAASVSANRIRCFLGEVEIDQSRGEVGSSRKVPEIELQNLSVRFDSDTFALRNLNLRINAGESVAIIGSVGSGKTSLLLSILNEVPNATGTVLFRANSQQIEPVMAYVPQESAIINGDLRENILFGGSDELLQESIFAAALSDDLIQLPAGLNTEIGEQGVNLSGGQKQRVGIARAVIHDPGLILLDDPMSAVDEVTEDLIMQRLIFGRWKDRTRLVVTHRLRHLRSFDRVIVLDEGRVIADGKFDDLKLSPEIMASVTANDQGSVSDESVSKLSLDESGTVDELNAVRIVVDEDRQVGSIHLSAYRDYLSLLFGKGSERRFLISFALLTSVGFAIGMPLITNLWLGQWASASIGQPNLFERWMSRVGVSFDLTRDVSFMCGYVILGVVLVVSVFFAHLVWSLRAVETGRQLHDQALASTLRTTIRFFDSTPVGRILNRFSRDVDAVERDLAWSFQGAINASLSAIASALMIVIVVPTLVLLIVPVVAIYWQLQKAYRSSGRETKRLSSVARSPRFAIMKETVHSISTIRAMNKQSFFWRKFYAALSESQRMFLGQILVNRWFSIRIPLLSSLVSLGVAIASWYLTRHQALSAGTAGIVLIYSMRFWETLNWSVRAFSEAESHMTSVERLRYYAELPQEDSQLLDVGFDLESSWPSAGEIEFSNVSIRYDIQLPDVVKNLSIKIPAGKRTALVGRTGSGKSTLVQALFRFVNLTEGTILIDGVNIAGIPLEHLRRSLAIIPQDPVLFQGTLRNNIDRFSEYSDAQIWDALERVGIHVQIRKLPGQLTAKIRENGLNLSLGQRQLICLARAVLVNAKIIVMDEATASLDVATDLQIQRTIVNQFNNRTVLVVAHRPSSIKTCEFVVELSEGKVVSSGFQRLKIKGESHGSAVETFGAPG